MTIKQIAALKKVESIDKDSCEISVKCLNAP